MADLEASCIDSTPDNTKVFRVMGDFHEFLARQRNQSPRSLQFGSKKHLLFQSDDEVDEQPKRKSRQLDEHMKESLDLKIKLKRIEGEHMSEKKALIKSNIALEAKCKGLETEIFQLKEKCETFQVKNKHLTEQNMDMVDKVKDAEQKRNDDVLKWESNYSKLENIKQEQDKRIAEELSNLETENRELRCQHQSLQSQYDRMSLSLNEAYAHLKLNEDRLETASSTYEEHEITVTQLAQAQEQIHQLANQLTEAEDLANAAKAFKEDMSRLRYLETECKRLLEENRVLSSKQENNTLLREQLLSAESKLSRAESKCIKADQLEVVNEHLVLQLKEKEDNSSADSTLVKNLELKVSELQHHIKLLEEKNITVDSEYNALNNKYLQNQEIVSQLNQKSCEQQEAATLLSAQLLRLKKRASLLARERDSLREILQSYDAELTMTSHATQLSKRLANSEDANGKLHTRIEKLEKELQSCAEEAIRHKLLAKHGAAIGSDGNKEIIDADSQSKTVTDPTSSEVEELKAKVGHFEKERVELLDTVEYYKAWIEKGKIKGDYDPENTKILHFTMNPADLAHQKAKQDLADLKKENCRLMQKIKEMQEGHDVSVSEIQVPREVKNQLAMAELRNQRLKEVFNKKIQEFRQACYSLTGYRFDISGDSKYKLVSMYAESQSDYLLFQMGPDGNMHLLETEFSKSLDELISLHLHHQNSIPMFLSAVSVTLFGQQTMISE